MYHIDCGHVLCISTYIRIIVILLMHMNFTLNKIYVYNSIAKTFNKHFEAQNPINFLRKENLI